jgi:hypothetical protein
MTNQEVFLGAHKLGQKCIEKLVFVCGASL